MTKQKENKDEQGIVVPVEKPKCGIIMPISSIDNCTEFHWRDVKDIIDAAIEDAGYEPNLVSNGDEVGVIQNRIIENLYDNPIVVCDVSGRNPNVMLELGMRLAFDKPTIIVKDDKTPDSFDTSPIERLEYPRDLRYGAINIFKKTLSEKIKATIERANNDKNYTTFLKHFGRFVPSKIGEREFSKEDIIIDELDQIKKIIRSLSGISELDSYLRGAKTKFLNKLTYEIHGDCGIKPTVIADRLTKIPFVKNVWMSGNNKSIVVEVVVNDFLRIPEVKKIIENDFQYLNATFS